MPESSLNDALERCLRRDPAHRGLLAAPEAPRGAAPGTPPAPWERSGLQRAVASLRSSRDVALVTGFVIPLPEGPVAETDGPPGAVLLADVLMQRGARVRLLTDAPCERALRLAAGFCTTPPEVLVCPVDPVAARDWLRAFRNGPGRSLSHLVAIERVGPAHTPQSLAAQARTGPAPLGEFLQRTPPEHFGRCHNMRGELIDAWTAPLHDLFEPGEQPGVHPRTMAIGDGGNEIGMGAFPWEQLAARLDGPQAAWIPCRIPCDDVLVAGVSNWGGFALGAALAVDAGRPEWLDRWSDERSLLLLEQLVESGAAVDGCTRRPEATVDGLPFPTYLQPWVEMRELVAGRSP